MSPVYEIRYTEEKNWKMVSEKAALRGLLENYGRITPMIIDLLHGKEINTQFGIVRIKNYQELTRFFHFQKR